MPLPTVRARPTSPHWRIYRWQIGSSLSILHRLTGIALTLGLLALCYWLVSLAGGEKSYAAAARVFASPFGLLVLVSFTFAFIYHLFNGVRHLLWDAGYGFESATRHVSGWFALIGALFATLVMWALVWRFAS